MASEAPIVLEGLPEAYGQTRVVLLPVDPYLVHVYWEVAPHDEQEARQRALAKSTRFQSVLRFYDVTQDPANGQSQFDIDIELAPGNWYVRLLSPEKRYLVDLGLRTDDGSFIPIARSNVVHTPRAQPSTNVDERYLPIAVNLQRRPAQATRVQQQAPVIKTFEAGAGVPDQENTRIARPIDMAEIVRRKLAELYGLQSGPQPPTRPALTLRAIPALGHAHQAPVLPVDFSDLTEMNERSFAAGISSRKS